MQIKFPFVLETERLRLRSPSVTHARQLNQAICTSLQTLQPWMHWAQTAPTQEDSLASCRKAEGEFRDGIDFRIHIFTKSDEQLIGCTGLHSVEWEIPKFEIGYWVRQSAAGKGYITEAVSALTAFCFAELKANRVEIMASTENKKSCKVAERAGFQFEGTLRNFARHVDGSLRSTNVYARIPTL